MQKVQITDANGVVVGYGSDMGAGHISILGYLLSPCDIERLGLTVTPIPFFHGEKVEVIDRQGGNKTAYFVFQNAGVIAVTDSLNNLSMLATDRYRLRPYTPTREYTVELTDRQRQALIANADKRNNDSDAWLEAVDTLTAAVRKEARP